jgi:hypothetical protein
MKRLNRFVLSIFVFLFLFGFTGCIPQQNKTEQFTGGLVDLITQPLEQLEEADKPEYPDTLSGELMELANTRSHEMSTTIEIEDLGGLDNMGFDIGRGSRLELDTAYDVNTGDTLMEVNVVNLANVQLALHNEEIAVDLSSPFMQQMVILEYTSDLDFSDEILITDRLADLMNALDVADTTGDDLFADLQTDTQSLLERYSDVIAGALDEDQITSDSQRMDVLGRETKVQVLSLSMDEGELEDVLAAVLAYAEDDDELVDVVMKYADQIYPLVAGYEPDPEERRAMEEDFQDSISYAVDDLDDMAEYWDEMDITVDIYYRYEGFLSRFIQGIPILQSKKPVALSFSFENDWSELSMFLKFAEDDDKRDLAMDISFDDGYSPFDVHVEMLTDGQEFILSADGDMDGATSFTADLTNTNNGGEYVLDGEIEVESYDLTMNADISGVTRMEGDTEFGEFDITASYTDYWGDVTEIDIVYTTELTQIRSGSSYESVSDISADVSAYGESISADLAVETTWNFSDDIEIRLPDFDDPDAERYNVEDLFGEFSDLFYYGW